MQESGQLSDSAAPLSSHLSWDASCKQIQVLFDNMPWKWWSSNSMLIADERHISKELCSWHYLTFFGNPQRSQGANSHEGWIAFVAAAVPSSGCSAWPAAQERCCSCLEGVLGSWGGTRDQYSLLSTAMTLEWCLLCQQLLTQNTLQGAPIQLNFSKRKKSKVSLISCF